MSPARIDLAAAFPGQADQVGQVRAASSSRPRRSPAASPARSRRGRGHRALPGRWPRNWALLYESIDPGGQGVAGGLGRGDADDRAEPGGRPCSRDLGQDAGLAGAGRGVDHRHAAAVGQHRQRGGGLVLAQPRSGALPGVRVVRLAFQRTHQPFGISLRARGRRRRETGAARPAPRPARPGGLPWSAGRAWRSARRRGGGGRCARRRAAGRAGPRRAPAPPGTAPDRTPSAGSGPPGPPAARRPGPGPGPSGAGPGPGT